MAHGTIQRHVPEERRMDFMEFQVLDFKDWVDEAQEAYEHTQQVHTLCATLGLLIEGQKEGGFLDETDFQKILGLMEDRLWEVLGQWNQILRLLDNCTPVDHKNRGRARS